MENQREDLVTRVNNMTDKVRAKKIKNMYRYCSLLSMFCSLIVLTSLIFVSEMNVSTTFALIFFIASLVYCGVVFSKTFKMIV